MKLSTKIFIVLFVLTLVPAIWLGRYFLAGIVPSEAGFKFSFSPLGITGICFIVLNIIFGSILYFRFLRSLALPKALFFSIAPLTVLYGVLIFLIADLSQMQNKTATSVRALLNINPQNQYNTILWAVLISVVYISALFLIFLLVTKPVSRMEKIINRLSDGKVNQSHFKLGGGKQFKQLEHSLNKINYNYHSKDQSLKDSQGEIGKLLPKQMCRFLGKDNLSQLGLGLQVKKQANLLYCDLKSKADGNANLEDSFAFISSYMNTVSPIIQRYGGFIDKYLGDGVLAVFERADNALNCAQNIIKTLQSKNKQSKTPVDVGISLHSGEVVFGIVGDEKTFTPTIVSDVLAFVEKENKINDLVGSRLIFSKNILSDLPSSYKFLYRYIGSMSDKTSNIKIFESLEVYPKDKQQKLASLKGVFEQGIRAYQDGRFLDAKNNLAEVLRVVSDDKVSYVYFNRASEKCETK